MKNPPGSEAERAEEKGQAANHDAGRAPTVEEEAAADHNQLDPDVVENYEEYLATAKKVRCEGKI
ncbi:MAG: hypothetical protein ACSLFB_12150 [Acidimicrobiales bacterium]